MAKATFNSNTTSNSGTLPDAGGEPASTMERIMTVQTSRRSLLSSAGLGTAALAAAAVPSGRATAAGPDPVVKLWEEYGQQLEAANVADERMIDIRKGQPEAIFHDPIPDWKSPLWEPLRHARGDKVSPESVSREGIGDFNKHTIALATEEDEADRRRESAERLAWWDVENARLGAARDACGYTQAYNEFEAASAAWLELERIIARTHATSLAGVIVKLKIAADTIGPLSKKTKTHEHCVLAALGDLERLAPGAVIAPLPGAAAAEGADPIFAAIAEYEAADGACNLTAKAGSASEETVDAMADRASDLLHAVAEITPNTAAGVGAKARLAAEIARNHLGISEDGCSEHLILAALDDTAVAVDRLAIA